MKKKIITRYLLNIAALILIFLFVTMLLIGYYNNKIVETEFRHILDTIESRNVVDEFLIKPNFSLFLVDDNGNSSILSGEKNNIRYSDVLTGLDEEGEMVTVHEDTGYTKLVAKVIHNKTYAVTFNGSTLRIYDTRIVDYLIIGIIGVIALSAVMAYMLANSIAKPVNDLAKVSSKIAFGEVNNRVELNNNGELKVISDNFNKVVDRLENTIVDSLNKQNQFDSMLTSMNSGVIAIDKEERIIAFNTYARSLFGIFKDFKGENIRDILKDYEVDKLLEITQNPQELQIQKTDLKTLRFRTTGILGNNAEEVGKVIVIEDATELKKLESMRSQFVANVSHELKTPLTSIKGYSETLRDVDDPVLKNKFLDIIDVESDRLQRLIEDILSLSSIENNEEVYFDIVDSVTVALDACRLLEKQARDRMVELSLTAKGKPLFIGDNDRYKQMIINLVDNAIKYTPNGGKVKVRIDTSNDIINISISDNGVGIPESHIPRLFERFYRVSKSRDRAKGGTGLGLAIVKHIVMAFNGNIDVESKLGRGTVFTITIPRYIDSEQKESNEIVTYVASPDKFSEVEIITN